ncbi:hypothetical protein [Photobacterium halotolerans]|uniref:Uncharacterized protein n=1 Tax=Photobacterium halotolerans TaxID=265726 RepID=A0A0F5VD16_9GAMM|nr:hypothetical protein [Photobacterium halotolerans]KKD00036.1 hypothetical protein KY46_09055 [Photobacterium halotolerans]
MALFLLRRFILPILRYVLLSVAWPVTGDGLPDAPEFNASASGSPFHRFDVIEAEPVACQASVTDMLAKGLMMKGSVRDAHGWTALLSGEDGRLFKVRPEQVIGPKIRVLSVNAGQTELMLETGSVPGCPGVTPYTLYLSRKPHIRFDIQTG